MIVRCRYTVLQLLKRASWFQWKHRARLSHSLTSCFQVIPVSHFSTMASSSDQPVLQIYRRNLPSSCIAFSSADGKAIFREALLEGTMECYFRLAAQFRTQDEPAFCGLTTLVMVLNALEIDPGKIWKGPWRWYHEKMLDCCIPMTTIEKEGISFDEFICLAKCNALHTEAIRATEEASIDDFRNCVKHYVRMEDAFVIVSYSRAVLKQTGDGHFSPIGGYHEERDLVLILDTARFKYPPHWVPLTLIWEAMQALDVSIGQPRGYLVASRYEGTGLLSLFRISSSFSVTLPGSYTDDVSDFVTKWQEWLKEADTDNVSGNDLVSRAVNRLLQLSSSISSCESVLTTQFALQCLSDEHVCTVMNLLNDLEKTEIFKIAKENLNEEKNPAVLDRIGRPATKEMHACDRKKRKCDLFEKLTSGHFVAVFLLCWPYNIVNKLDEGKPSYAHLLNKSVISSTESCGQLLRNELQILRRQFSVLLKINDRRCCMETEICQKNECPG